MEPWFPQSMAKKTRYPTSGTTSVAIFYSFGVDIFNNGGTNDERSDIGIMIGVTYSEYNVYSL